MKTGIIGLPQVGKTSLFRILTKVNLSEHALANPREAHIGVAKVPDERLDKLAALYKPCLLYTSTWKPRTPTPPDENCPILSIWEPD